MSVAVPPRADHADFRTKRRQQLFTRGVFGAVVAHNQGLNVRQRVGGKKLFLRPGIHVAGDEQIEVSGGAQQGKAAVVVAAGAHGRINR
ncbi:hypothetical protein SDC9_140584 [bioreactor metagenome]|uniref:Uncharacterized protein n=1 Tax=bioreactor metagenome TaxID=1076179 RepID=A0A645DVP3_9ZZZZ